MTVAELDAYMQNTYNELKDLFSLNENWRDIPQKDWELAVKKFKDFAYLRGLPPETKIEAHL